LVAQNFSSATSWGNNGLANDYYYGDQSAFQLDDNMFTYGSTATQNMTSTSYSYGAAATFETAASYIESGTTLADFTMARANGRTAHGGDDHRWETDDEAPIGDGLWILLLLAVGYGVFVYRRRCSV